MKDLEYITENLKGVSEDAYQSIALNLQRHNLSIDASAGWLYCPPPHSRQFVLDISSVTSSNMVFLVYFRKEEPA
jgi:hypothetical protein